jgi:predicted nucleotidyltransferase
MDIIKVITILSKEFSDRNIQYALIGGFAMNALGMARSTVDIDFLVLAQDTPKLNIFLESLGYSCVFKSENVSQYISSSHELGEIDVLHAFRSASLKMLKRSRTVSLFNNTIALKVLLPEDLVGLKLQASLNDKSRELRELADIHTILERFKGAVSWEIIEEHFNLFEQQLLFRELKEKYG